MTVWKFAVLSLAYSLTSTNAFVPNLSGSTRPPSPSSAPTSRTTLFLTSEEILARARKASGQPEQPDSLPLVFDEDILADMQSALLMLEKRVQDGPGSLTHHEIKELTTQLDRIVAEMHQNPHRRHQKPVRQQASSPLPDEQAAVAPVAQAPSAAPTAVVAVAPPPTAQPAPTQLPRSTATSDESDDEGPTYDGTGGMGQPRGTVNTYIIEGMDEMTSEEYRLALQQSIIDKQRERRKAGKVGNRGSLDYMNSLSPGGTDSQRRGEGKDWNAS